MSKENMGELKARDVMKGLSKLMISHPNIITGTHDQIQNMLKGKPGSIKLMKTSIGDSKPKSSDALFANHMNHINGPMNIQRDNGIITIHPKDHKPINWQKIGSGYQ